jgi:ELWxxDGT repeat protein
MVRRLALVALVIAGCKTPSPPTNYGVDLTVSWSSLQASDKSRGVNVTISVTGDEKAMKTLPASDFKGDDLRVQYVPQVSAGTLDFAVALVAADGSSIAYSDSGPVTLQAGKAVMVTLALAPASVVGGTCSSSLQCGTAGGCVNSVCCTVASCPPCQHCGGDGKCAVAVTNGTDPGACDNGKSCDANGSCVAALGSACTTGSDCGSGNCVGGFCCGGGVTCGSCRQCGSDGQCSVVVTGATSASCSGMCDANGNCLEANGGMCTASTDCVGSNCSDGVCCDSACTGTCQACNGATPGTCSPVTLAEDVGTCSITSASGAEMCDATGACATPHLVMDINTTLRSGTNTSSADPGSFVAANGNVFFLATNNSPGFFYANQLWVTDGTAANTHLLHDFGGTNQPAQLMGFGGGIAFRAVNAGYYQTLWKSDGTAGGTVEIASSSVVNGIHDVTTMGGALYFGGTGSNGLGDELWKSDGTSAGTVLVKDILSGVQGSSPHGIRAVGSSLIFFASDTASTGPVNMEPWISDGTGNGTHNIVDLSPGVANTYPSDLTNGVAVVNNKYVFAGFASAGTFASANTEIFATDGTSAGTVLLRDIFPGNSSNPGGFGSGSGVVYFSAQDNVNGRELWKTDGTQSGTVLVADIWPGITSSSPHDITPVGSKVYFGAMVGPVTNDEPFISDGTSLGTVALKDLNPGTNFGGNSYPTGFTAFAGKVFFAAPQADPYLWVTDGTGNGTYHACLGAAGAATQCMINAVSNSTPALAAGGHLFYRGDTGDQKYGDETFVFP